MPKRFHITDKHGYKNVRFSFAIWSLVFLSGEVTACRHRFGGASSDPEAKGVLGLLRPQTVELYLWAFPRETINSVYKKPGDVVFKDLSRVDRPMCYYHRYVNGDFHKPGSKKEELAFLCSPSDTKIINPKALDQEFVEARLKEDQHKAEITGRLTLTGALVGGGVCGAAFGGFMATLPCSAVFTAVQRYFFAEVDRDNSAYRESTESYHKSELSFEAIRALERTLAKTFEDPIYERNHSEHFKANCPSVDRLPFCERFAKEGGLPLVSDYSGLKVSCANLGKNRLLLKVQVLEKKGSDPRSFDADGRLEVKAGEKVIFQKKGGALDSAQYAEFTYAVPHSGAVTFSFGARVQIGDKIFLESVRQVNHTFYAHPKIGEGFDCRYPQGKRPY